MDYRPLGTTGIDVSAIALGCWPISGMTSLDINDADSLATIRSCFDLGINFLDTAYCYGGDGESERLIAKAIEGRRDEMVIATKGGIHWESSRDSSHLAPRDENPRRATSRPHYQQCRDASPATLKRQCEESLRRLRTDRVELLYLHAPDPKLPVAESAGGLRELLDAGKTRSVGVSNLTLPQLEEFSAVCPIAAYQPPYNMLLRDIEADTLPWCRQHNVAVVVYWPLMKGLLAGKLARDHVFAPGDGRVKYPMFQGDEWRKNQDLLDELRAIAADVGRSVAQVVINWTIHQPGITSALCGAKRPWQNDENAGGADWQLSAEHVARIDAGLARRGQPVTRWAVTM
jgi:aryl-alcohol dehydrogenase-like predicted oxidoreductase